jgi:energy-coupling factor transporter ATP-binding protein EcfA2
MKIRIRQIRLDPGGPLRRGFELTPGSAVLVHGPNESGKSFIVDAILSILFPKEKKLPGLRSWTDIHGRIVLECDPGGTVELGASAKRKQSLPEVLEATPGEFPASLPGLISDRGHDISVSAEQKQPYGVERGLLAEILAGRRYLDNVFATLAPQVLKENSGWAGGVLNAARQGLAAEWFAARDRLESINVILDRLSTEPGVLRLRSAEAEIRSLEEGIEGFEHARRGTAWKLFGDVVARRALLDSIPDVDAMARHARNIEDYIGTQIEISSLETRKAQLIPSKEQDSWAESALSQWDDAVARVKAPSAILVAAALLPVAAAAAAALTGYKTIAGSLATFGLITSFAALMAFRRHAHLSGHLAELEGIRINWRERYGTELRGKADLIHLQTRLREALSELQSVEKSLAREKDKLTDIRGALGPLDNSAEAGPQLWKARLEELRLRRKNLEDELSGMQSRLASLGGTSGPEPAVQIAVEYDPQAHDRAAAKLKDLRKALENLRSSAVDICRQAGVLEETGGAPDATALLAALDRRRQDAATAFKAVSAELLAHFAVRDAVGKLREKEDEVLREALAAESTVSPLRDLTSRYLSWELTDAGLGVISDRGEHFALDRLSTGTAEQAMLALRIGLLRHFAGMECGFLLLDDSIQHTDYRHRQAAIDLLARVVESGWQVIFFTMDDHLRDAFRSRFSGFGAAFSETRLGS